MSKIADLLPCPFCGGKADFSETNAWWVRCNECNAETEADMSPEGAAEYWNKRTPPPSSHVEAVSHGWRASHISYHRYPYSVEWISDAWHLRFHHGNGAQHTVSKHTDPFEAMSAAPSPQTNVALPEAKQLTAEIHGEGHAADEGDPVVDCHRDASQKVSSESIIAGEQLLSKMPHGHAAWKAEAFDKIVAARKKHVDAVEAYNNRLTVVRSERERGNHSMRLDDEYEAMSEAHAIWHRTCQEVADDALATMEGAKG